MSDLRQAIRAAKDAKEQKEQEEQPQPLPAYQKASIPENQNDGDGGAEMVNLTIKVRREQRTAWLIAAKRGRTSLTAAIIEALDNRFVDTSKP